MEILGDPASYSDTKRDGKKRSSLSLLESTSSTKRNMTRQRRPSPLVDDPRLLIVELERLMHAMNHHEDRDETWHSLQFKVDRCLRLWNSLESAVEGESSVAMANSTGSPLTTTFSEKRIESLKNRVHETVSKVTANITVKKEHDTDDLVDRVFFARARASSVAAANETHQDQGSTAPEAVLEPTVDTGDVDFSPNRVVESPVRGKPSSQKPLPVPATPNVQDLQKKQREQVEEAISHMASQLKAETARIHETLSGQTAGLDTMEDLATENVQQVSEVAKDVRDHVQSSWSRTIGTWTLFFTMLGTFVFTLVMIQVAPKGKACVFFCPPNPRPDEFCRTLPNGRLEYIRVEPESPPAEETELAVEENVLTSTESVTCEMDIYGECVSEDETAETIGEAVHEKIRSLSMDDLMFGEDNVVEDMANRPNERLPKFQGTFFSPGDIRNAANTGDLSLLRGYVSVKPEWINMQDNNGWAAVHLSARRGEVEAIDFLREIGADLWLRTVDGRSAQDIAMVYHGADHPIVYSLD